MYITLTINDLRVVFVILISTKENVANSAQIVPHIRKQQQYPLSSGQQSCNYNWQVGYYSIDQLQNSFIGSIADLVEHRQNLIIILTGTFTASTVLFQHLEEILEVSNSFLGHFILV